MKTVLNKTRRPLKIQLSRGKVLHLGPRKEGQIAPKDAERGSIQELLEAGELEIVGDSHRATTGTGTTSSAHPGRQGHHPSTTVKNRGDR